jgi:hypothetical protein
MANPQNNGFADHFNTSVAQAISRSLQNLTVYAHRGWELCVCCRVMLRKAFASMSQKTRNFHYDYQDHYSQFEYLLESGYSCGLCNLFLYSLMHGERPEHISHMGYPNSLLEISALRRLHDISTPMNVCFGKYGSSKGEILPNAPSFSMTCGTEDGPMWCGTSICCSAVSGKVYPNFLLKFKVLHTFARPFQLTLESG